MSPFPNHILSIILCTPLAGALVLLLLGDRKATATRWLANAFAAATFLLAVPLWFLYEPLGKTWQFAERGEWIPAIGAAYYIGVDGFSILLILLTTLMGWMAILASWTSIRERVKQFHVLMLVLQAGLLGAFMALDFLLFFLSWQVVLVTMYFIIGVWGGGIRWYSARKFFLYALAGSVMLLVGLLALYFSNHAATGTYSFDMTRYHTQSVPFDVQKWVFLAFFLGFAVTVPLLPFHRWLPDAHSDAPTAGSVMLAAVLLKVGTYGFIRFSLPILPDASRYFVPMIAWLAIVGMVVGALLALWQSDWKRLFAYSSVSYMALAMLGMFALTPAGITGSLVQQLNHGISIGALYLLVGIADERRQTRAISGFDGLWRGMPVFAVILLLMILSAIGLPASNGFIGARLILEGVYAVSPWWAAAAAGGITLCAWGMLRLYRRSVLGRSPDGTSVAPRDLTAREVATLVPLVGLAFWIGLYPAPVLQRLETSVGRVVARVNPAYAPLVRQGSDCPTPAAPDPAGPPPEFLLTEPCADPQEIKRPGR